MKRLLLTLALALAPSLALAQNAGWPPPAGAIAFLGVYNTAPPTLTNGQVGFAQLDSTGHLLVSASVSASVSGFLPSLSYNTCTATGSQCTSTALPTNTGSVVLFNSGTTTVSCTLASGTATAAASELQIPASSGLGLATTGYDHYACIDQTGSTSNVVIASGGTGLATGWGGGGSSGGGGAITAASGAYASGSIASGAMVDLGSQADAACATDNGSCSLVALTKRTNQNVTTLNTTAGSAIPAGTNLIGQVSLNIAAAANSATNGIYTNMLQGNAVLSATNGIYTNLLQGNAVNSVTNPIFVEQVANADPCSASANKTNVAISMQNTTTVKLVALSSAKQIYICSLSLIASGATVFSIADGTKVSTECDTAAEAVMGATVASHGLSLAANGGVTYGSGTGTVARTTTAAHDLCLFQSGSVDLSGNLTYVQQ